ncbi:MAG TPA: septum formation initiator family protein [Candidatus Faecalibacterium intestinigallinarum]|uniref:Septum formation initiator family protein n=1 Tax=Candidatus Faecalibacterium intestinigallinarum TaxID=2838581 RepID=A0A9D1TVQ1_9FIRM|nr:septum formation initiator family protein [Candidatus Faecalibacterium intestinigallinarum]
MARTRKKAKTLWWAVSRLFFILLLLSMLAAYVSNQVTISSKQAELDALNEQIAQQQSENEELERILSGDPDEIVEWIARDSYGYAAPNERIIVDISGN